MSVAILGAGLEGLLVAHAAQLTGQDFTIYDVHPMKSFDPLDIMNIEIPNVTDVIRSIGIVFEGSAHEWTEKAGYPSPRLWDLGSGMAFEVSTYGSSVVRAYERLRELYGPQVNLSIASDYKPLPTWVSECVSGFDTVVSTLPRPLWGDSAQFGSATVYRSTKAIFEPKNDNTVIYDGSADVGFCRVAKLFGDSVIEWPESRKPPIPNLEAVQIPTRVTGALPATQFTHLGRYAQWRNDVTPSDVYRAAVKLFSQPEQPPISDDELWETNPYATPKE